MCRVRVRVRVAGSRNGPERQEGLAAAGGSEGPGTVAAAVQELEGREGLVVVWKHRRVQAHVGTVSTTDSSGSMCVRNTPTKETLEGVEGPAAATAQEALEAADGPTRLGRMSSRGWLMSSAS